MTSLPASDPGSAAVWGSKRINPRPQSCLCLTWSGYPSNDDDDDECYRYGDSDFNNTFAVQSADETDNIILTELKNEYPEVFNAALCERCCRHLVVASVANSSPQIVFRAHICFDFAKFAAIVFLHVIFRSLQTRLAAPFRSLHNVYLPPWQPSCNNFAFLVFSFCIAFTWLPPTDRWLIAPSMLFCVIIIIITAFRVMYFRYTAYRM